MPAGDRTGPAGMGPMTGRGAGFCAGYPSPGYMNPYGGRYLNRGFGLGLGGGRGFGRGRGMGFGRGWGRGGDMDILNPTLTRLPRPLTLPTDGKVSPLTGERLIFPSRALSPGFGIYYLVSERNPENQVIARRDDEAICLVYDEIASSLRSSQ